MIKIERTSSFDIGLLFIKDIIFELNIINIVINICIKGRKKRAPKEPEKKILPI